MAANYTITPDAEQDVTEASDWYEGQQPGLADVFLDRFRECVRGICASPAAHQVIFKAYRKSRMKQFPYAVYYDWDGTTVTVHCAYHTARDPSGWQQRLP